MKNKLILVVVIVLILSAVMLCSCSNYNVNPFEEGTYEYEYYSVAYDEHKYARFVVTPIDENEFNQANGINVVKDKSGRRKHTYYRIEFWYGESKDNCEKAEFVNLNPVNGCPNERDTYIDDNGSYIIVGSNSEKSKYEVSYFYEPENGKAFKADVKRVYNY